MPTVKQKIFIARILNQLVRAFRRLTGRGMRAVCTRRGVKWDLDLDEGIDLSIYVLGAYEPSTIDAYTPVIREGDTVFDIGANIGAHTLHFARLVGTQGQVHAFEPTDYAVAKLKANLALNPPLQARVEVNQCFLVGRRGEIVPNTIYSRWPVANDHTDLEPEHFGKPEALVGATSVTADDFCESAGITRIDFVKIDVDGNELSVLTGFSRGLARFRPTVLIELAPFVYSNEKAVEFDQFIRSLLDLGYRFTNAANGQSISGEPDDLRKAIKHGGAMNCLLYPAKKT